MLKEAPLPSWPRALLVIGLACALVPGAPPTRVAADPALLVSAETVEELATPAPHALAAHRERLAAEVFFLAQLADIQARLVTAARQDPGAVAREGRRGAALCENAGVGAICRLLPATLAIGDGP